MEYHREDVSARTMGTDSPATRGQRTIVFSTIAAGASYGLVLLQQVLYARVLGADARTDALAAGLAWAATVSGVIGWSLIGVLVPLFARGRQDPDARRDGQLLSSGGVLIAALVAAGSFTSAPLLALILLPDAAADTQRDAARLIATTAPLILLWSLTSVLIALANAHERFVWASATIAIPPVCVISVLLRPTAVVDDAALGYVVGATVQVVILAVISWPSLGELISRSKGPMLGPTKSILHVGTGLLFLAIALTAMRSLASVGFDGEVSIVDYAIRLTVGIEQVAISAIGAIALTTWSVGSTKAKVPLDLSTTFRVAIGMAIGSMAAFAVLAPDLVNTSFLGGKFSQHDAVQLGLFLQLMAPGVAVRLVTMLLFRALLASGRVRLVTILGAVNLVSLVGAGTIAHHLVGLPGIAVAYSLSWLASAAVCWRTLERMAGKGLWHEVVRASAAIGVAAVAATVLLHFVKVEPAVRILAGGFVFAAVGWGAGWLLGVSAVRHWGRRLRQA